MVKVAVSVAMALFALLIATTTQAAIDAYPFPDDAMRARHNALIDELRCPQCLNTNLAGSDAMIAQDLRREVHRMLLAGQDDDEILDFMHQRYGDFILYRPRFNLATAVLWLGPIVFLGIALLVLGRVVFRAGGVGGVGGAGAEAVNSADYDGAPADTLTEEQESRMAALLQSYPAVVPGGLPDRLPDKLPDTLPEESRES